MNASTAIPPTKCPQILWNASLPTSRLTNYAFASSDITVEQMCVNNKKNFGFCYKRTKIGVYDVTEVLKDLRYGAKLNCFHDTSDVRKSKMATA